MGRVGAGATGSPPAVEPKVGTMSTPMRDFFHLRAGPGVGVRQLPVPYHGTSLSKGLPCLRYYNWTEESAWLFI
jgi:hypothetical protein